MNELEKILIPFTEWDGEKAEAFFDREFKRQMLTMAREKGVDSAEQYLKDMKFDKEKMNEILYYIKQKQMKIKIKNKTPESAIKRVVPIAKSPKVYKRKQENTLFKNLRFLFILIILWAVFLLSTKVEASSFNILEKMNLEHCRVVQEEHSHIKKSMWSTFAYDLACVRGKSFNVYTPTFRKEWTIKYIGKDKYIWNYVTIGNWDLSLVYGHTQTPFKVGYKLGNSKLLGTTDLSWTTQNYHLHLEMWAGNDNINFKKYTSWLGITKNQASFILRMQRGWVYDKEINQIIFDDMIKPSEWFSWTTYWDIKQWTNWWGTKAMHRWETINKKEANKRGRIEVQRIRTLYKLDNHPLLAQKAVVSFVYNLGSLTNDQQWLLSNKYYSALWNDFKLYNWIYVINKKTGEKEKKVLGGLVKRRGEEDRLLKLV